MPITVRDDDPPRWYKLPTEAYDNELFFFDTDEHQRNVPAFKKNKCAQMKRHTRESILYTTVTIPIWEVEQKA